MPQYLHRSVFRSSYAWSVSANIMESIIEFNYNWILVIAVPVRGHAGGGHVVEPVVRALLRLSIWERSFSSDDQRETIIFNDGSSAMISWFIKFDSVRPFGASWSEPSWREPASARSHLKSDFTIQRRLWWSKIINWNQPKWSAANVIQ